MAESSRTRNCLILSQYREGGKEAYNDFIGKFYHFPTNTPENYLKLFTFLPVEFIYWEPEAGGKGEYFGYGRITKAPFPDKREEGYHFVEIDEFKLFSKPIYFKNEDGMILEAIENPDIFDSSRIVRQLSSTVFEKICSKGGFSLAFKADAHLVQVLGEQLIESEKVGILELIKNSLDAGATKCRVLIENIPGLPKNEQVALEFPHLEGPVILIEDNGKGMDLQTLENGWLRPATTIKTSPKEKLKKQRETALRNGSLSEFESLLKQLRNENRGRIPLGEKGVGRFATHRLGRKLELITKTSFDEYEWVLNINWDDFEIGDIGAQKNLESIPVFVYNRPPSFNYGPGNSGTRLIISGGRKNFELTSQEIREISESINAINSPNPNPNKVIPPFKAVLEVPQVPGLDHSPIYTSYNPIFTYSGIVNENGIIEEGEIRFSPPKSIPLPAQVTPINGYDLKNGDSYWHGKSKPRCGQFYFHIDLWYRDKEWIEEPDAKLLFDYLETQGGISLYRDGTLILPAEFANKYDLYGFYLKASKQGYRISYRNMVGNIELDQSDNSLLIDKTSREGLINNKPVQDYIQLVKGITNLVEQQFVGFRDEYTKLTKGITRDPAKLNDVLKQQRRLLGNIEANYPIEEDPYLLFKDLVDNSQGRKQRLINLDSSLKNLKSSIELMEEVQELLKEKAGYGLAVAVSVHEIAKITGNFYHGIMDLIRTGKTDSISLNAMKDSAISLQSELRRLSPLRSIRNERPTQFPVSRSIKFATEIFKRKFQEKGVIVEINLDSDFLVFARFGTLNQILVNLLDNSLHWLESIDHPHRRINITIRSNERTIIVADSGPGVAEVIRPYLFEPGYSLKVPPSGLGLYICKHYMTTIRGAIYETRRKDRISNYGGAQFTLDFERVPSRQEEVK